MTKMRQLVENVVMREMEVENVVMRQQMEMEVENVAMRQLVEMEVEMKSDIEILESQSPTYLQTVTVIETWL
jgi:hypothetical protein